MGSLQTDLPDLQQTVDKRGRAIQKVGIQGYRVPFKVRDKQSEIQSTVAEVSCYCSLSAENKGANMSRFGQTIMKAIEKDMSIDAIRDVLRILKEKLKSDNSYVKFKFPYFTKKKSPVSDNYSYSCHNCAFEGRHVDGKEDLYLTAAVEYMSSCPCSRLMSQTKVTKELVKAILPLVTPEYAGAIEGILARAKERGVDPYTDTRTQHKLLDYLPGYGSHDQRSEAKITIHLTDFVWIEDIVDIVDSCASAPIFNILKRPDEKFVTELSYLRTRFTEDIARDLAGHLEELPGTDGFVVVTTHFESIHQYDAVSVLRGGKHFIP